MSARMPSIWEGRACRAPICPRCPVLPRTPPCRHSVHAPCLSAAQSLPSMCRRCCNYFFPLLSPLGEPGGGGSKRPTLPLSRWLTSPLLTNLFTRRVFRKYYDMSTNLSLSRVPRTSDRIQNLLMMVLFHLLNQWFLLCFYKLNPPPPSYPYACHSPLTIINKTIFISKVTSINIPTGTTL